MNEIYQAIEQIKQTENLLESANMMNIKNLAMRQAKQTRRALALIAQKLYEIDQRG